MFHALSKRRLKGAPDSSRSVPLDTSAKVKPCDALSSLVQVADCLARRSRPCEARFNGHTAR